MIIDPSAVIAILRDEPEAAACASAIEAAARRRMSAANFLEAAIVVDGSRDPVASRRLDDLIARRKSWSNLCPPPRHTSPAKPTAITAGAAVIPLSLTSAIALPTRYRGKPVNRCCSKEAILPKRT
jgi:hypothetical protein